VRVSKKFIVTDQEVQTFAVVSRDTNPIHLSDEYAKNTIFKKRIVHGMLLGGYISSVIANDYPGNGSIYLQQTLLFKNPCYIDEEVEVIVELLERVRDKYRLSTKVIREGVLLVDGEALIIKKSSYE
jgi:3-hydroxybutyryl-CoA dehydratase